MIKQNLINRLNTLEKNHKVLSKDKNLNKFLDSLPDEDKKKIYCVGNVIIFKGRKRIGKEL